MRILASLFLFACAVHSPFSFAAKEADPVAEAVTKRIAAAKNWKQLIAGANDLLPGNVVKEMENAAADAEFPEVRLHKGELIITDEGGTKLNILLDKEGKVFINGKRWLLKPLAKVEDELTRLREFIGEEKYKHRRSMLDVMLPSAYAGISNLRSGVASFVDATARVHEGTACGEENLSNEQLQRCPLMAVPMLERVSNDNDEAARKKMHPIKLKCPSPSSNGVLELVKKNKKGQRHRTRVTYKNNRPTIVAISVAPAGSNFVDLKPVDLQTETDTESREFAKKASLKMASIKEEVCEGTASARSEYFAFLASNDARLNGPVQNVNDSSSGQSGGVSEAF